MINRIYQHPYNPIRVLGIALLVAINEALVYILIPVAGVPWWLLPAVAGTSSVWALVLHWILNTENTQEN